MAALARLLAVISLLAALPTHAHLMAAQKGSLNLVGEGGFLVMAVPVSAFRGVDDDGDGRLSRTEALRHAEALRQQIQEGVQLRDEAGPQPLQLVMLDVAQHEGAATAADRHLMVMGRFALGGHGSGDALSLRFMLFGNAAGEQQQDITVTREGQTQWLRFQPGRHTQAVLPGTQAVLAAYGRSGAEHVLGGADHLLFLLVVLAAGWQGYALLGVLSAFTAGHALTLALSVMSGWQAPAAWVEPAIAATLIGMAGLDGWARWRGQPLRMGMRLTLIFSCALIHGLGLAGALTDLTAWPRGSAAQLWALAGFNLGIEAAQVAVAAAAGTALWLARAQWGPQLLVRSRPWASAVAAVAGCLWLLERVAPTV